MCAMLLLFNIRLPVAALPSLLYLTEFEVALAMSLNGSFPDS